MIYQPYEVINLLPAVGLPFLRALFLAAVDFIAGNGKPWSFYLGLVIGGAAAATGIPGAAGVLYAICDTVDFVFFKSPDGSLVRWYLNGIAVTDINTFAEAETWEVLQMTGLVPGQVNEIRFEILGASTDEGATGIPWFAVGPVTLYGEGAYALGAYDMATVDVTITLEDIRGDRTTMLVRPDRASGWTAAQIQEWLDAYLPLLDDVTDAQIVGVSAALPMTVTAGLKATPTANGAANYERASVQFNTSEERKRSIYIQAINRGLVTSRGVVGMTAQEEQDFLAAYTTGLTVSTETARPVSIEGWTYDTFLAAKLVLNQNEYGG